MKNLIFTFVIFGIILVLPKQINAQLRHETYTNSSELKLRIYDNSMFIVIFDRKIYDYPTAFFSLSDIQPGSHRIVIKQKRDRYSSEHVIYNGSINIPPRTIVHAKINKFGRLEIIRTETIRHDNDYNNGRYDDGYNNYYNDGYYNKPLLDLPRLENSLRLASFESDKIRIAQQAISSHTVRANQIYRILMMFSFESNKLKLAKFSYGYCIDKNNYYLVNDALTFSSSIRELDDYIRNSGSSNHYDNWDGYQREYNDSW